MGRQLASYGNICYTYNEDGIRTSKTANNVTTRYYLDGTNIIAQTDGTNTFFFRYDSNDEIVGLTYLDADYFYVKNQMGDITGISDTNGNLVAAYEYDPWGAVISVTGSNIALANANPFRYRSYYYDFDTGMYYLQSRYYDPDICRFINADDVNYFALCNNAFAYCENNPVSQVDSDGLFGTPIQWACAIIGGIVGIPFGKWLANKLGYYSGAKYIAIRAAAIVGGAVLGWFAGTLIIKLATRFILANPTILNRIPGVVLWFLGIKRNASLKPDLVAQLITSAKRVGSALKSDLFHRAASWLSNSQLAKGKVFYINNGKRILLQVKGTLNGKYGIFEYIIDEYGNVCHQLFKEGGVINGRPN